MNRRIRTHLRRAFGRRCYAFIADTAPRTVGVKHATSSSTTCSQPPLLLLAFATISACLLSFSCHLPPRLAIPPQQPPRRTTAATAPTLTPVCLCLPPVLNIPSTYSLFPCILPDALPVPLFHATPCLPCHKHILTYKPCGLFWKVLPVTYHYDIWWTFPFLPPTHVPHHVHMYSVTCYGEQHACLYSQTVPRPASPLFLPARAFCHL